MESKEDAIEHIPESPAHPAPRLSLQLSRAGVGGGLAAVTPPLGSRGHMEPQLLGGRALTHDRALKHSPPPSPSEKTNGLQIQEIHLYRARLKPYTQILGIGAYKGGEHGGSGTGAGLPAAPQPVPKLTTRGPRHGQPLSPQGFPATALPKCAPWVQRAKAFTAQGRGSTFSWGGRGKNDTWADSLDNCVPPSSKVQLGLRLTGHRWGLRGQPPFQPGGPDTLGQVRMHLEALGWHRSHIPQQAH